MYIERSLSSIVMELSKQYPVVTIVGPRQSGKTTLVQHCFPNKPYISLEDMDVRTFASSDPRGFLAKYPNGCILDEIQRVPDLLSYIQTRVDEHNKAGEFILTGSHQLSLHQAVNQSLAGRTCMLDLLPLSFSELKAAQLQTDTNQQMLQGFYPRLYQTKLTANRFYHDYIRTYIERDVRNMIQIKDLTLFETFLAMLAGRVGQLVNFNSLAAEIGVSSHTLKNWLSVLDASFITLKLKPFHENINKRLVKSAKVYFYDTGLVCALLGIKNVDHLSSHPLYGNLFENMIVSEIHKQFLQHGEVPHLYFYRDQNQREIDLVVQDGHQLIPIEIKSSQTFHRNFLKNIQFFQRLFNSRVEQAYLLYAGSHDQHIDNINVIHYTSFDIVKKFSL